MIGLYEPVVPVLFEARDLKASTRRSSIVDHIHEPQNPFFDLELAFINGSTMKGISVLFVALLYSPVNTVTGFTVSRNERGFAPSRWSDVQSQRRQRPRARETLVTSLHASAIQAGDTVLVVGGTGGVGQLVTKKLKNLGDYKVRVTSRDEARGREILGDDTVDVVAVDLLSEDTAALKAAMDGVSALVISIGTTAFPTKKWAGGNTPKAIDDVAVKRIAKSAQETPGMKKVVIVTSVGVERTKEMPFLVLNLFGVLDDKRNGEDAIISAAESGGFDYAIVRPGRLVGGPYTNLDVARLLQIEGGESMVL